MSKKEKPAEPQGLEPWEKPVEWSESFKLPSRSQNICLKADSFQAWCDSVLPELKDMPSAKTRKSDEIPASVNIGDYILYRLHQPLWIYAPVGYSFFGIPLAMRWQRTRLEVLHSATQTSYVGFDKPVDIPVLAKRSVCSNQLDPWMSLTPNEVLTQRGQIRRAKGKTCIAGLGMGWFARRVLERKQVEHVTIVEKDPHVLAYFGEPLEREFSGRVTLIEGNAYEHSWDNYDVSLWDIWEKVGDSAWDHRFLELRDRLRKTGRVCEGWTCWASLRNC
jgi:hypothetical protein